MSNQNALITGTPEQRIEAIKGSRLKALIPDEATLNKMAEAVALMLNSDNLRACEPESIFGAVYKAATLGFRIDPTFGECWLIPRRISYKDSAGDWQSRNVCTFQVGYKGWKALCLQSGNVAFLQAHEVYAADNFKFQYGTGAALQHVPADENDGKMTHFYAFAKLANGMEAFEVINIQEAERSRRNSETQYNTIGEGKNKVKVFSDTPKDVWGKFYAQMALRVPVKRLCAALPLTPAIEAAMREDGGVTFIKDEGAVTFESAQDLDKYEPAEEVPTGNTDATSAEKYVQVKDAVESLDFAQYQEYLKGFAGSEAWNKDFAMREMLVRSGLEKCECQADVKLLYALLPAKDQQDKKLKSLIIEKGKSYGS